MISPVFKRILPYAIVVFFGYVGFSLPLPILPEMFLDPEVSILPLSYPIKLKTVLLGAVMSAYPLGQLIGAPLLGKFSDRWGRKKIILISLFCSMFGYIFTAIATSHSSVPFIFFGLFLCGFCEGNVAIAQSVAADLASSEEERHHKISHFGWINLFACLAFVVGPLIGGQLSDSSFVSWFTFATPFWIAAIMTLFGVAIILIFSKETRKEKKIAPHGYWKSFQIGFRHKKLRMTYFVNFFLALGYFSYFRFFPVYIENRFSFSASMLGYVIAYGAIAFAFCAALFLKPISRALSPKRATFYFSILLALTFFLVLWPSSPWDLLWTIPPIDLCLAVVMTNASVLVSNAADEDFQGQALGMLTSVQVLAEFIIGIGGGVLAGYLASLPMIMGSFMVLVGSVILLVFMKRPAHDNGN
jgi:MFS transporter, DHA1 family, tetracycline resistance protein